MPHVGGAFFSPSHKLDQTGGVCSSLSNGLHCGCLCTCEGGITRTEVKVLYQLVEMEPSGRKQHSCLRRFLDLGSET